MADMAQTPDQIERRLEAMWRLVHPIRSPKLAFMA
jgi:hypothetical protein